MLWRDRHLDGPFTFFLCFFVHGLNVCTSVVSDCDPMLSICAWESQPSGFVLMGPDRSPICSAQRAALQLDADAILHHKTQYQQSWAVTTKSCFWHWILFTHLCVSSSTYYLQRAHCFCNSLTNKYRGLEKLKLMSFSQSYWAELSRWIVFDLSFKIWQISFKGNQEGASQIKKRKKTVSIHFIIPNLLVVHWL